MRRWFEPWIGRRYLGSTRGRGFLSFIAVLSIAGVAVGVAVLIVVLSVMNGFERELRERILSMTAHATISAYGSGMADWQVTADRVARHAHVVAVAPYVEEQALMMAGQRSSGVLVRGILPATEREVSAVGTHLESGSLDALESGRYGIVLGDELARALAVKVGDRVVVVVAQGLVTPAGVVPRMRRFEVVGIFHAGMYEYDRNMAYLHLADAARLYRLGDTVSGLRLRLDDMFAAPRIVREIALALGGAYYVDDWTRRHANFFRSIELTKSVMFIILLLVVTVAVFNIVSTLVMVVKDKRADIAILRTMGTSPGSVLAIFVTQGTAIGIIGTLAGLALGVLIADNLEMLVHGLERLLDTRFLDAKVYFMSDLPAEVRWPDVLRICGTAFGLACLSTLYPAWRAARTQPAEALRHD
jgi:lipoprotein-releasing system permease protein